MSANFWKGGNSVLEYTFNTVDFGTKTVCKVHASGTMDASDSISKCVVGSNKVTLTWNKDTTSVDFSVCILNM